MRASWRFPWAARLVFPLVWPQRRRAREERMSSDEDSSSRPSEASKRPGGVSLVLFSTLGKRGDGERKIVEERGVLRKRA